MTVVKDILSIAYLGNIEWFGVLSKGNAIIDINENYVRQSYRNRCEILGANGKMALTVNVVKPSNTNKTKVKDIRIDYSKKWKHQHLKAIVSSYSRAPFFDHYWGGLDDVYNKQHQFLTDLNLELLEVLKKYLQLPEFVLSNEYLNYEGGAWENNSTDFRKTIDPRIKHKLKIPAYWQVFSDRFPFETNLSIIDLLFNEGPASVIYLNDLWRHH